MTNNKKAETSEVEMTETELAEFNKALANLRKVTTMTDQNAQAVALNKFRDHLVASAAMIRKFNEVVTTLADFRGSDWPVSKIALRKPGAGRKAAEVTEAEALSKLLG